MWHREEETKLLRPHILNLRIHVLNLTTRPELKTYYLSHLSHVTGGPPGVLGILGEWLFIFRDLGSTGNYFRGAGEQVHSLGDLGSPAKKQ